MNLADWQFRQQEIEQAFQGCRAKTLKLIDNINDSEFFHQAHPHFSPVGWHLGHIAWTEAYWILEFLGNYPAVLPEYEQLFTANGLPKSARKNLPALEFVLDYLQLVRSKTLHYLENSSLAEQERLWWWLLQHEIQHRETISFILQLHRRQEIIKSYPTKQKYPASSQNRQLQSMQLILPGAFYLGGGGILAQDNELPRHQLNLPSYYIDTYPVTCQAYQLFIEAGGYQDSTYWSELGWQWLQKSKVTEPLYWLLPHQTDQHPVCGVSYYEAEAYAKFVGKRLPTEAEWEKAAQFNQNTLINHDFANFDHNIAQTTAVNRYPLGKSIYGCYDMLGNVWEWTSSWFAPYPGFEPYPYQGYSQVYFDNQHKVLKGGSWSTGIWALRNSFRNWYQPHTREIWAGFRCAKDFA